MKIFSTTVFSLVFFCSGVFAQVVVNEFSASNLNQFQDNYQNFEDWIELYNTSNSTVNVGGF
ncbi:MAG: hypothetical protein ACJAVL_000505, partial [Bacteroidia bacterium]